MTSDQQGERDLAGELEQKKQELLEKHKDGSAHWTESLASEAEADVCSFLSFLFFFFSFYPSLFHANGTVIVGQGRSWRGARHGNGDDGIP